MSCVTYTYWAMNSFYISSEDQTGERNVNINISTANQSFFDIGE